MEKRVYKVAGDGNCFYRALAQLRTDQLYPGRLLTFEQETKVAREMRQHVADYLRDHPELSAFAWHESGKTAANLVRNISKGRYAENLELSIAASLYKVTFVVHKAEDPPGAPPYVVYDLGDVRYPTIFELMWSGDNHYDPVLFDRESQSVRRHRKGVKMSKARQ